jgi:hypothetical protein
MAKKGGRLVVLVLEDVAVPDEQPFQRELRLDACDLAGTGQQLPIDDLELDQVDVDRVRVGREVVDLPDLGGPERPDVFRRRIGPCERDTVALGVKRAEPCFGRASGNSRSGP